MDSGRCPTHAIALDPHGACLLCARESTDARRSRVVLAPRGGPTAKPMAFAIVLASLTCLVAYMVSLDAPAQPFVASASAATKEPLESERGDEDESATAEDGPSYRERLAAARAEVHVILYATSWCPSCRRARDFLNANRIGFVEYDVDRDAEARARWEALNPARTIPVLDVEGEVHVGFGEDSTLASIDRAARRHL